MVPNPIKMDDLGVALFLETPIWLQTSSNEICSDFWPSTSYYHRKKNTDLPDLPIYPP